MRCGIWVISRTELVEIPQPKVWTVKRFIEADSGRVRFKEYFNVPDSEMKELQRLCEGLSIPHFQPFCAFNVDRRFLSDDAWVDVCSWTDRTSFTQKIYVVGTSKNKSDRKSAPSKVLAFIGASEENLLQYFSSCEQQIAKQADFLSELPGQSLIFISYKSE